MTVVSFDIDGTLVIGDPPGAVTLELAALRNGKTLILKAKRSIDLAARANDIISAYDLIGSFFDISYAYRFQAPQHARAQDLVCAQSPGILELRQYEVVVQHRLVQRDRLKPLRMRSVDRRRRYTPQTGLATRRIRRSLSVLAFGILADCFFDDAH